jgi:hypothetical protein
MLTAEQAKNIVDSAIREVARAQTIAPGKRIVDLGIDSKTKLGRLQAAIARAVKKLGYSINPGDLRVSATTKVSDLRTVLRAKAQESRQQPRVKAAEPISPKKKAASKKSAGRRSPSSRGPVLGLPGEGAGTGAGSAGLRFRTGKSSGGSRRSPAKKAAKQSGKRLELGASRFSYTDSSAGLSGENAIENFSSFIHQEAPRADYGAGEGADDFEEGGGGDYGGGGGDYGGGGGDYAEGEGDFGAGGGEGSGGGGVAVDWGNVLGGSEKPEPPKHIARAKPPQRGREIQQQQQEQQQQQLDGGAAELQQQTEGGGETPPMRIVECTPQIEKRKELEPGKAYRCAVWVDQGPAAKGADVQRVKVELPANVKSFSLEIWFDSSSHFAVEDLESPPTLDVKVATGMSNERAFTLRLIKAPDEKPMFVTAFFRFNGRPCGKITRFIEMGAQGWDWKDFVPARPTEGEVVLPNERVAPGITVETMAKPAEIRVEVLKTEENDLQHFTLKCWTPQDHWEGAWNLPQITRELVKQYMQNFMSSKDEARIANLRGAGVDLWKVLPKDAKSLLWNALERGAKTMSVISEEPYIPWELMVPFQTLQKQKEPLGVELQLGRWVTGDYKSARQKIPMKTGYVIAPTTSGLKSAAQEVSFLTEQLKPDFNPADTITPASFKGVNQGLRGPVRDVIHFICHGKSATLQTLELEKPDTLNCSQVQTLAGFLAAFKSAPLAFLNACEVGGEIPALDGVGGFANSFIELGASAVVAPLWAVQDGAAFEVTKTFYQNSLKGMPFAETMKQIRARAYSEAVDSYAAYCFYGDPMASAA